MTLPGRSISADGDAGPDELVGRTARSAEWRREAWAAVGVLVSELALPVLTLGLPGDRHSVTGRVLDLWRGAGEPGHLSLRQLVDDPPTLTALAGAAVFVCENPAVVSAAADRLGPTPPADPGDAPSVASRDPH